MIALSLVGAAVLFATPPGGLDSLMSQPALPDAELLRHGRTAWNLEDRVQGSTDIELDPVGRWQAQRAARLLTALQPDRIVSSDLLRARATAEELSDLCRVEVHTDERLRETFGGHWQGRTVTELMAVDAAAYVEWRSGADVPAGGGERRTQVATRVVAAIGAALTGVPEGGTLVVGPLR